MNIAVAPPDTTATAGATVIFTCVAVGVPLEEIVWLKDGYPVADLGPNRVNFTQRRNASVQALQSILQICSLQPSDTGMYTCRTGTGLASANFTLTVITASAVIVAPPLNQTVVEGGSFELVCSASGAPVPVITWGYEDDSANSTLVSVSSDGLTMVNSTLYVVSVNSGDSLTQQYTCNASNDFGSDAATATVTVQGTYIHVHVYIHTSLTCIYTYMYMYAKPQSVSVLL